MILIKSAQIIDGTGKPPYRADVLLKNDRISAIGDFPEKSADKVIAAAGMYLSPGFIDVQSSADHYLGLFTNPSQDDFLLQGVTTAFGGHCGSSLAPLLYGTLESIRKWTNPNQVNVNWHTVGEYLNVLGGLKLGINFGTLIGHSTIRRALIGETLRDLTDSELQVFCSEVAKGLKEGAFGFSTGLSYIHSHGTPFHEVKVLLEEVKKFGGVYATHIRNERENVVDAVREAIQMAKETGVPTIVSHLRPLLGFEKKYEEALRELELAARDLNLHFDTYPFDTSVVAAYTLLPPFARQGNLEAMTAAIANPVNRERLLKDLRGLKGDNVTIADASMLEAANGKTLKEFAENRGLSVPEALLAIMELTRMRAVVFVRDINLSAAIENAMNEFALISANSGGLGNRSKMIKNERFLRTFPRFLEIVEERKAMSLEAAVARLTSAPAKKFGLIQRGIVAEGAFADLVVFERSGDNRVAMRHVFVNGAHAVDNGSVTSSRGGRVLRRS